jgi:hypothetical protein
MLHNIGQILHADPLVRLVQPDNFVGWVFGIDYDRALVMTNDLWKARALGVPQNCFLVAATFDPDQFQSVAPEDREVLLFRVLGSAKLPQDDDLVRTKIDFYQHQESSYGGTRDYDDITLNQMQFGGLECRVLGTFYTQEGALWLGSDLESYAAAARLNVYRPRGEALGLIVNYLDPMRRQAALAEAAQLGITRPIAPFRIGTVRYTSTARMHRRDEAEMVPVLIQPSDYLARRTGVLGMTRTGKSNLVKQTVAVVKRVADEGGIPIGQIIYDMNGEYANANQQDRGSIADVYPADTVRYRMLQTRGFLELQNNFYVQLAEGYATIRRVILEKHRNPAADLEAFLNTSFDEPDPQDQSAHKRWRVRCAAYQAMLHKAGFPEPTGQRVSFEANANVRSAAEQIQGCPKKDPKFGLSLDEAVDWFLAARQANRPNSALKSSSGKPWLDNDTVAILNMLANKNEADAYINGYKVLVDAVRYHSPRRSKEVGDEIYEYLKDGRIVILDLSVGDATLREKISKQVAQDIFSKSMGIFIEGKTPPNIVVYIEEAHNLIGKGMELTETWPRLAKEGAKYRIALVYATQEVSSVHPNILANTENWFITHLNNEAEIKVLAQFYDFADFSRSLIRAQDVGFARVKTLSGPYVVPVQIDRFDPDAERRRVAESGTARVPSADGRDRHADLAAAPVPSREAAPPGVDGDGAAGA